MATQKIEYQNKVAIDDVGVPEKNKITADNMNEIKEVVNNNADNFDETTAATNERIDTANNAINNIVENTYTKTETDEKLAQKADISDIPTDLSQLSNATTKFVNETQLQEETTARENADNDLQGQIDAIVASSDVVDIVGTYQELENYDTSHLGDNDIIKVLQDSTHNNATSYYRWKKHTSTWQYIGSEGPYYTKSESNEKFVEKETGKGLSSNDFTNAYRTKLDGIESGAEVNIIEKIKLNGTELPISNKGVNIPVDDTLNNTSTNPIQNKKVFEALEGKEDSSNKTDTLNSESTSTQYPNAEVVYNALVEKQNQIDELQEENNKLKADHPPIEEEGTDLTLEGTGDFDLALSPKGNITQETTTGKNLLPNNATTTTLNGITFTINEDKSITLNGTSNGQGYVNIYISTTQSIISDTTKTYTFSKGVSNGDIILGIYEYINNTWVAKKYATTDTTAYTPSGEQTGQMFRIVVDTGKTLNNVKVYPMLVEGTTVGNYEKYTGGQASPNPSYPSSVKVIDGEYEVEVENKNLINIDLISKGGADLQGRTFDDGVSSFSKGNGVITFTTTTAYRGCFTNYIEVKENTAYKVSFEKLLTSGLTYINVYMAYDENKNFISRSGTNNSFTTPANTKYLIVFIGIVEVGTGSITNVQLEQNSTATSYIAHAQQTQTIDTSPNPLYSEDDYYYKQNGNWYVHNEKIKFNLSRVSSFNHPSGWANATAFSATTGINHGYSGYDTKVPLYCNRLIDDTPANIAAYKTNAIGIGGSGYTILLSIEGLTTSADYVNYFQNNETYLYLPLETPTNTQITNTTLINQLEALLTLTAYQDQTNISQTHNTAQADMKINAKTIMSMRYLQNEIEELKQAILNS